ncbi:MAG: hypothetical protein MK052_11120 [Alphaproteobacteria bacterium]|nr:hypothetical protein [Alphaproteobacteria bacterium]
MRLSSVIWVMVVVVAASMLYGVKYSVQTMDEEIAVIQAQIKEERNAIHVLKAEWAYLSRPERIRILAEKHLQVQPMDGKQMLELADVPFSPDAPVQLVHGDANTPNYNSLQAAPIPRMRPGVIPAGGMGYVR